MVDEDYVPHLKGTLVARNPIRVSENYTAVHDLLSTLFRREEADLPHSLVHFMGLVRGMRVVRGALEVDDGYLIARHVAILPSPLLASFVISSVLIPQTLTEAQRLVVFSLIDSVNVGLNFYDAIRTDLDFEVLRTLFEHGYKENTMNAFGVDFKARCPLLKSRALSLNFRASLQHCGIQKRPVPNRNKVYVAWKKLQVNKKLSISDWAYEGVKESTEKVETLLRLLFTAYPNFLPDLQTAFFNGGVLRYFCINPTDHHAF